MLWGFGSLHGAMTLLKRPAEAPFCALGVDFRMTHGPMTGWQLPPGSPLPIAQTLNLAWACFRVSVPG